MERYFDQQIEKLRTRIIKMSSLVNEQIDFAIRAIINNEYDLIDLIIDRDKKVDKYDLKIEKACIRLVALNQPVAMDLRMIISSITINTNLERIGDLAVKISHITKEMKFSKEFLALINFNEIASITKKMVDKAIDSYIHNNLDIAKEVLELESSLNMLMKDDTETLINIIKDTPQLVNECFKMNDILHALERVGDHTTNIVEDIFFILEAHNIRHKYYDDIFKDEPGEED